MKKCNRTCNFVLNFKIKIINFGSHEPVKRKIRYPGDIDENRPMSPNTTAHSFRICKNKIKIQAKQLHVLKQKVKRQQIRIDTLKALVRKLKLSFGLSGQAAQSIQVTLIKFVILEPILFFGIVYV